MKKGLIINHNTSYIDKLHELFSECDVISYNHFNSVSVDSYDYFVLSGGEIHISDKNDIVEEKLFLSKTKKPIFAICLGMQIISIINGEELKEIPYRVKGFENINLPISGDMYYNHGWYIENIPLGFEGIKRRFVKAIWNKQIFAVQGHPEYSGEYGLSLKKYFMDNYVNCKDI